MTRLGHGTVAVERTLGVVEGVRLARHPVLWASMIVLGMYAMLVDDPTEEQYLLVGYGLVVPAFVAMVLTAMAVRRSRVAGADEVFATFPAGPARRTVAHGVSTLVAGAVAVVVTCAVWLYRRPGEVVGRTVDTVPSGIEIPRPTLAQFLQGPMAVVVLCALGIALARWVPTILIVPAMVIPFALQLLWFGLWQAEDLRTDTWWWPLATGWVHGEWVGPCSSATTRCDLEVAGFDRVTPWWHLAYLVALGAFLVVVAVLRHRRDRVAWTAFAVSLAAAVTLALVQGAVHERFPATPLGSG